MRVFRMVGTVCERSFAALALAVMFSCAQTGKEAGQKWLSFRCPDGQTVMAQFQLPEDQFVNVRFAGRELRLPHVISGAAIVSVVMSLPTTGPMLLDALRSQDMYLAGSFLMFMAFLTVIGVFISDLALAALDPRIRLQASRRQ